MIILVEDVSLVECICTLYSSHARSSRVIVGDSGLCCCGPAFIVMCDVNCSNAITSHCLLILQKRSRPYSVSDYFTSAFSKLVIANLSPERP